MIKVVATVLLAAILIRIFHRELRLLLALAVLVGLLLHAAASRPDLAAATAEAALVCVVVLAGLWIMIRGLLPGRTRR